MTGTYDVEISLTNATFPDFDNAVTNRFTASVKATTGKIEHQFAITLDNVRIRVNEAWDGATPVELSFTIIDKMTVAEDKLADGGNPANVQDSDTVLSTSWQELINSPQKSVFPDILR